MRPFRQHNAFSCGPIAISNALRWQGYKITREYINSLIQNSCGRDTPGIAPKNLSRIITTVFNIKPVPATLIKIKYALNKKSIIMFLYLHSYTKAHICIIHKITVNTVFCWNINCKPITTMPLKTLIKALNFTIADEIPIPAMWVIRKDK